MAALCAMNFCKEAGFFEVLFEGDATQVVKEINSAPPFLSKIGHFIKSIHSEMSWFRSVVFSFIPRECNTAAHTLAKEATRQKIEMG
jgi:ribonuclease HI